jgi:hypothetical protein
MLLERDSCAIGDTTQSPGDGLAGYTQSTAARLGLTIVTTHETRFCRSFDGVVLAYAIDGDGPPMVKAIEHAHAVLPNH